MSIYSKAKENEVFGRYWPYIGQKDLFSLLFSKRAPLPSLPTYLLGWSPIDRAIHSRQKMLMTFSDRLLISSHRSSIASDKNLSTMDIFIYFTKFKSPGSLEHQRLLDLFVLTVTELRLLLANGLTWSCNRLPSQWRHLLRIFWV